MPAIRDAARGDTDLLAAWAVAMAWETERKRLDETVVRRGVEAVFADPRRGRYLLAEHDTEPTGTLLLTYEWSDWRDGDWWWIQSVYVPLAHRRRGVFRALFEHVRTAAARTPRVCGLRLYVERANNAALATYLQLGMHDSGYRMMEIDTRANGL